MYTISMPKSWFEKIIETIQRIIAIGKTKLSQLADILLTGSSLASWYAMDGAGIIFAYSYLPVECWYTETDKSKHSKS